MMALQKVPLQKEETITALFPSPSSFLRHVRAQ